MPNFYRWHDEPDKISITLKKGYLKYLTEKAIKQEGVAINFNATTLYNYKNEVGVSIGGLKKILDILNINYDRINHQIEKIGWNNSMPKIKESSKDIAILLAASLADGHLDQSHFMYKNKNKELINRIKECTQNVFGNSVYIDERIDRNGTHYILCASIAKRVLERLGSPRGKKMFFNPYVPEIIMNGTKDQKKFFIQQFFDDEGCPEIENMKVSCSQNSDTTSIFCEETMAKMPLNKPLYHKDLPRGIKIRITKPNVLCDIKKILLQDFNISTEMRFKRLTKRMNKKRCYISATWELFAGKRDDITRFTKTIGFFSSKKQAKLNKMLKPQFFPQDMRRILLETVIKCYKQKGYVKVNDLAKETGFGKRSIRKRLSTFVKHGFLKNTAGRYTLNFKI